MPLDLTPLIPIYQAAIDSIINQMGKPITIYYKQTITNVQNQDIDVVRDQDMRKPDFLLQNKPVITENTEVILGLIEYNPKDFARFAQPINFANNIIQIKTFLTDIPKLLQADYIVPNKDSVNYIFTKYRIVREPIPIGLQKDRYALSFWERIL